MASGIKLDAKNERIVRGLMKLPENRKCINCMKMGPQYVCTNFSTFICANCSGIHREFTHRVKSVSMAKFTTQEVAALQEGGNKRAKEYFFKEWVQHPDSSNAERLRTFIKHVYVDRKFTGDKRVDRAPPKGDVGNDQRKDTASRSDSRSPPYDSVFPRPRSDRSSPGSNQYSKGNQSSISEGYGASDEMLQNHCRKLDAVSSPVTDISGSDTTSLQVDEPQKSNGEKITEISTQAQRTRSMDSMGSTTSVNSTKSKCVPVIAPPPAEMCVSMPAPDKIKCVPITIPSEVKSASLDSLIDFNEDFGPPATIQQHPSSAGETQATFSQVDGGNWAVFDSVSDQSVTQKTNSSSLGSDLSLLLVPENISTFNNAPTLPNVGGGGVDPYPKTSDQFPASQENMSTLFASADDHTSDQFPASQENISTLFAAAVDHTIDVSPPSQPYVSSPSSDQNSQNLEAKPSDRRELSADLFSMNYAMIPGSVQGWQAQQPYGIGSGMQYPTPTMSFPCPSNMENPFEVSNQSNAVHPSTFPSMAPLQATLPNPVDTLNLLRNSSFEGESQWMPQQQIPNLVTTIAGGYSSQVPNNMGQQASSDLFPIGNQVQVVGEIDPQSIDPSGMNLNLNNNYPQLDISNSFTPPNGNPFG